MASTGVRGAWIEQSEFIGLTRTGTAEQPLQGVVLCFTSVGPEDRVSYTATVYIYPLTNLTLRLDMPTLPYRWEQNTSWT